MQIRQNVRWQISRKVEMKIDEEDYTICYIKDISLKGMKISLKQKLRQDKLLRLSIILSYDFTLNIEAWVVWHKALDGVNLCGLYFAQMSDAYKETIYQFIRRYYPQELIRNWWQDPDREKGGEKMQDRRIFARFTAQFPLRFLDCSGGREGEATACDFSAKGVGLLIKEQLAKHTPLEMWLKIPDSGEPLYARGKVVWSNEIEPDKHRAGVSLERADLMGLSRVLRTI